MITIKKTLNTSMVLVERNGREMILLGKGIGFGRRPGTQIDPEQVDQVYLPVDDQNSRRLLALIDAIPAAYFDITRQVLDYATLYCGIALNERLLFALAEHLHFAVERAQQGIVITNRVYWEIKTYYPKEFHVGENALQLLREQLDVTLPIEEAANVAFHLINAQSESDDGNGIKYARMIDDIVNLVRYSLGTPLDTDSVHYSRFITHVKFFVERFYTRKMVSDGDQALFDQIASHCPQAMKGAQHIRALLEEAHGITIPIDEITYLAVHINRLLGR